MRLQPDDLAVAWTAARLGLPEGDLQPARGAFVVDRAEAVSAGVVLHNYRPRSGSAEITAAAKDRRWLAKGVLRDLAQYVFGKLDCFRLEAHASEGNTAAARLLIRLGFVEEGYLRRAWDGTESTLVFGLLRDECEWYHCVEGNYGRTREADDSGSDDRFARGAGPQQVRSVHAVGQPDVGRRPAHHGAQPA